MRGMIAWLKQDRETMLHRVNPACKFTVFMLLLALVLWNRQFDIALHGVIAFACLLFFMGGYRWYKMLLILSPFLFLFLSSASTMILFGKGDTVWWQWGIIKVSEESFFRGLLLGCKTISFGLLGMTFALTTRPILFFYALMQQFRLPAKYGYSFIASIRMLPAVWEDIITRKQALQVRGVRYSKGIRGWYERLHHYLVPTMAHNIRRAQRVAIAMESKRFQMQASRTYYYVTTITIRDVSFILAMITLAVLVYYTAQLIPIVGWHPRS